VALAAPVADVLVAVAGVIGVSVPVRDTVSVVVVVAGALEGVDTLAAALVTAVGTLAAALVTAVGVTLLVAVTLLLDEGAGVPGAVVVPVGVGVVLARMGVAPSWAITMSSSASSRPTRRRSVMNEFSLKYESLHSPNGARAIVLGASSFVYT